MRVLGIVPARAGSKRLPGKNCMELGGSPLWLHALNQGFEAGCDWVVVTTDDPVIVGCDRWLHGACSVLDTRGYGEGKGIHQDGSPVENAIRDVLDRHPGYDALCLLNPTHPLRKVLDIRACIADVTERGFPSSTLCWKDWHYTLPEGASFKTMNAQDRIPRIVVSGECYVARVPAFIEFGSLMIYGKVNRGHSRISSGPQVDIDTMEDLVCARALYEHQKGEA